MIILPDRSAPRAKLLLPQRRLEWDQPSQRVGFGIPDQTRFRLTAFLDDGAIRWRGWFDDREDADAFLFAMACGSLHYERELWRLPNPWWHPDLGEGVHYDFATVTFLTSSPGTNVSWPVPSDYNSANNLAETVAGGGGGGSGTGGAGGGAYSAIANLTLTPSGTATRRVGVAGAGGVAGSGSGVTGGDSWFNGTTLANSSVGSKGGVGSQWSQGPGGAG